MVSYYYRRRQKDREEEERYGRVKKEVSDKNKEKKNEM